MKKIILYLKNNKRKIFIFSLLLISIFSLSFNCSSVKAKEEGKLLSLSGATITWNENITLPQFTANYALFFFIGDNVDTKYTAVTLSSSSSSIVLSYIPTSSGAGSTITVYSNNVWSSEIDNVRVWHLFKAEDYASSSSSVLTNSVFINFVKSNATIEGGIYEKSYDDKAINNIFDIFSLLISWLSTSFISLIPIFYLNGSLTTIGTLAVCGLSFSVILLIILLIRNFLKFRG